MTNFTGISFGRYHLLEQLGEGGMATVYKAYDTRLERDVAVKVIRRQAFPEDQLEHILKRFEREAKALARLTHPNIVPVIDYGEYEGAPYLVMPYLSGGTLKQKLGNPMPWQEALHILLPVAQALDCAHEQNIIHRDIKPSNILLTNKGQPMLGDFGIAKIIESEDVATLTGTGTGVGTPEYMAPEQWTGGTITQSDIYSLGVVLYELVTGRKPYVADTPVAILLKQATEPLPRPAQFVPGLPEGVEKMVLKAMARKPEDRYADMAAMVTAMETLLSGQSQPSQRTIEPTPPSSQMEESIPTMAQVSSQDELAPEIKEAPTLEQNVEKQLPNDFSGKTIAQLSLRDQIPSVLQESEVVKPIGRITPSSRVSESSSVHENWEKFLQKFSKLNKTGNGSLSLKNRFQQNLPGTRIKTWWMIGILLVGILVVAWVLMRSGGLAPGSAGGPGNRQSISFVSAGNGYIYFTSDRSGKAEVWIMDPKSFESQVTFNSENWSPVPAANGFLYYTSNRSGGAEVWMMDPKGVESQVTYTSENWSPAPAGNGYLYYTSNRSGMAQVWMMDPKGVESQVTYTSENWSPAPAANGYLYYTSYRSGKAEVWMMDPKGIESQVTYTSENWSPVPDANGFLYYTSNRSGNAEIWMMDSKGVESQVTYTSENWSPAPAANGYLYYTSNRSGKAEVWMLDPKGIESQVTYTSDPYESWVYYFDKPQPFSKR